RSRILIRRVELSSRKIQNGLLVFSAFIFFSLFAGGIYGVVTGGFASGLDLASAGTNPAVAQTAAIPPQRHMIDYSRPDESDELSFNAGGPSGPDELDAEGPELDKLMRSIQAVTNPAYLPSIWPHASKINNEYGFRRNPFGGRTYEFHAGMDIDGERGDIVVAPGNGIVREAGYKGGYGNMIEIEHGNGLSTRYGHLSKIEVEVGQTI